MYEKPDHVEKCGPLLKTYEDATTNYFIKCKFFHQLNDIFHCIKNTL